MEIVKKTFVKYGNCQYEFVKHGITFQNIPFKYPIMYFLFLFS